MEGNAVKAPISKLQHPEKFQASSSKWRAGGGYLDFEVWCFSGAWMLGIGAFRQ
jgi:hypothetical protein